MRIFSGLLLSILLCAIQPLGAQNVVQSFIEKNTYGNSRFGHSVASAGDVNHDGYADIIAGADYYFNCTGRAFIYLGGPDMDTIPDIVLTGETAGGYFGCSVSGAGDVNHDGYSDVIVGACYGNSNTGCAYIYYGGLHMNDVPDIILKGEGTRSRFGICVSNAGDVNHDGYSDVIVGADYYFGINSQSGRAYIYFGGSPMNTNADVVFTGGKERSSLGWSLSAAGDVNHDGYDDVIVGASGNGLQNEFVYILFGGKQMDNTADVTLGGTGTFGMSVSEAGDVNNDGYDDVIIGNDSYRDHTGQAYICFGGENMDSIPDVVLSGERIENGFGYWVSRAGDVNKDGFDDIIVDAQYDSASERSKVYFFFGGSVMDSIPDMTFACDGIFDFNYYIAAAGDVNNDGTDDFVIGDQDYKSSTGRIYIYYGSRNDMDTVADKKITGEGVDNHFGQAVSGAGDVNGDGFDDIVIGAPYYNSGIKGDIGFPVPENIIKGGRAYVYFGDKKLDRHADLVLGVEKDICFFGRCISASGDLNGDGYADIVVGARGYAFIYFGGESMDSIADLVLKGELNTGFGNVFSSAGDINNDGYDDIVVGVTESDYVTILVYYGSNPMDAIADVILTDYQAGWGFGCSLSTAGDINHDGYDDIVVGSEGYNESTGRALIFFGGNILRDTADVVLTGEEKDNRFGYSVSSAGDFNHDGYDDVLVGAYGCNAYTGKAYIYFGSQEMVNVPDITFVGSNEYDCFGKCVSSAGDVNNDGYDDALIADECYGNKTSSVYIFYGDTSMSQIPDMVLDGESNEDFFGSSLSEAGDVNDDGYGEVLIGAYQYPINGKAYLYSFYPQPDKGDNQSSLSVYPNPASDMVFIQDETGMAYLYDSCGRLILSQLTAENEGINIKRLPNGMYMVKVNGRVGKFVKVTFRP